MNEKSHKIHLFCVVVLCGALPACSSPPENNSRNVSGEAFRGCQSLVVPKVNDGAKYEQWHLLISKSGYKEWNGQDVDTETLKKYMEELAGMPESAGKLTIHIEPETPCQTIHEIQKIVDSSVLCSRHRCIQDRWDYERPIVN
jgi:hypothetical protein